jgi:hypothetical protein
MQKNTHEFEVGEEFGRDLDGEKVEVTEITSYSVKFDYIVNGEALSNREVSKETARMFIRCGHWK